MGFSYAELIQLSNQIKISVGVSLGNFLWKHHVDQALQMTTFGPHGKLTKRIV